MSAARKLLLLTLMMAPLLVHGELPPGISGAWYDPAAPGHGVSVEILEGQRALVFWSVFDPLGAPLTLYTEAGIEGGSIIGTAYAPPGMRFGISIERTAGAGVGLAAHRLQQLRQRAYEYDANGPAGGAGYGRGEIELRPDAHRGHVVCDRTDHQQWSAGRTYELAVTRRGVVQSRDARRDRSRGPPVGPGKWEGRVKRRCSQARPTSVAWPCRWCSALRRGGDRRSGLAVGGCTSDVVAAAGAGAARAHRWQLHDALLRKRRHRFRQPRAVDHITLSRDGISTTPSRGRCSSAHRWVYELKTARAILRRLRRKVGRRADGSLCFRHGSIGSDLRDERSNRAQLRRLRFSISPCRAAVQMSTTVQSFSGRGWTRRGDQWHALDIILVETTTPIGFGLVGSAMTLYRSRIRPHGRTREVVRVMKRLIFPSSRYCSRSPCCRPRTLRGDSAALYDPSAHGHGISIEILEGQRALVFWRCSIRRARR